MIVFHLCGSKILIILNLGFFRLTKTDCVLNFNLLTRSLFFDARTISVARLAIEEVVVFVSPLLILLVLRAWIALHPPSIEVGRSRDKAFLIHG